MRYQRLLMAWEASRALYCGLARVERRLVLSFERCVK